MQAPTTALTIAVSHQGPSTGKASTPQSQPPMKAPITPTIKSPIRP